MRVTTPPLLADCGVIPPEDWKARSGLAVLRAIIAGELPPPPISAVMGFYLAEVDEGTAVFAGTPGFQHYNPAGSVHGGYAGVLLDSCMTCAVQSTLPPGIGCVTLEYKVSLVRPMTADTGPIRAEGKVVHPGKRSATAEGRIIDAHGRVFAHGTTTVLVFPL